MIFDSYTIQQLEEYKSIVEREIIRKKAIPWTKWDIWNSHYYENETIIIDSCNCYNPEGKFRTTLQNRLSVKLHYYSTNHGFHYTKKWLGYIDGKEVYAVRVW